MSEQPEFTLSFRELLKRLAGLVRPHWKEALLVAALLLLTLGLELALPQVVKRAFTNIEDYAGGALASDALLSSVVKLGLAYLFLTAGRSVMMFVTGIEQAKLTQHILWRLRRQLYEKIQRLSFSFFDRSHSGQLISRVTTDVNRVSRFFNAAFFSTLEAFAILAGVITYMFVTNWLLAVVALSTVPVTLFMVVRSARRMRPLFREARDSYGDVTTVLQENIAGVKVVRAFAKEGDEISRFSVKADHYIGKLLGAMDKWALSTPPAMFVYSLNAPLILAVGGWLVLKGPADGGIDLGTLVAFILYMDRMSWRVQMIGDIINSIARAGAAADRIYEVLDAPREVDDRPAALPIPEGAGAVLFDKVTFAYDGGGPVLENVDLCVRPGQLVAVVGTTGAGKSTLVSLIPRFYDVTSGRVLVDGCDVRDMRLDALRRSVGLIFQETFLFSAGVRENIAFGRPDASLEEVVAAAKVAQAHDFIMELENGYDTIIGERGVTLSGGQRQRIAIARAVIANPRILIMDDATASVDSATERLIQEALVEIARGRTTFVIAHRVSTVRRADLIVVLHQGKIVEKGTHAELISGDGAYRQVYDFQHAEPQAREQLA